MEIFHNYWYIAEVCTHLQVSIWSFDYDPGLPVGGVEDQIQRF
jgi:hypothetical protein